MSETSPEQAVTELLHRLAEHADTRPSSPSLRLLDGGRRRPGEAWTARMVAALVLAVALAGGLVVLRADRQGRVVTAGQPAALLGGTTERLAASGLDGRTGAASVWTGKELLVWGGLTLKGSENIWLADGAALDPSTNRWRSLPPAPMSARSYPAAVWTGTEMLVWGGGAADALFRDGAAFNPATNRWRTMGSQTPAPMLRPAAVWTGTEMLAVSSLNGLNTSAYDPKADRWRVLAPPPGAPSVPYPEIVWTGTQAVVAVWPSGPQGTGIGSSAPPPTIEAPRTVATGPPPTPPGTPPPPPDLSLLPPPGGPNSPLSLAAFTPDVNQWTTLPAVPIKQGTTVRLVWTGKSLLVFQSSVPSQAFDFRRRAWHPLAPVPVNALPDSGPVWTGHLVLFWSGGTNGLAYDPDVDEWRAFDGGGLRARDDAIVAWADGYLVGWSGFGTLTDGQGRLEVDGVRYRPPAS